MTPERWYDHTGFPDNGNANYVTVRAGAMAEHQDAMGIPRLSLPVGHRAADDC